MEMLAAQAAHRDGSVHEDEDAVASNDKLSEEEKKDILQKALNMAASNGDMERIERILNGKAKDFVDVDAPDEDGTTPLIYASCFVSDQVLELAGYLLMTFQGSRNCCDCPSRCWCESGQAGLQPMECAYVGHDQQT